METLNEWSLSLSSTRERAQSISFTSSSSADDSTKPAVPSKGQHRRGSSNSSAAAARLWDIITSAPPSAISNVQPTTPRYERSQVNKTILHPKLVQPTPEEEEIHRRELLICGECSVGEISSSTTEADLRHRLSEALLISMHRPGDGKIHLDKRGYLVEDEAEADGPSPTSTLHFPDPALAQHAHSAHRRTTEIDRHSPQHSFVVCADSQIGMTSKNQEWQTELSYCRQAICRINAIHPRPKFVSICGDLIDMEYTFHQKPDAKFTKEECDAIQDKQNEDFKECWEELHPDIAVVCICGNHNVGNRPTKASIQRFKSAFGDEYLAFWVNGTYNIVLNNVLFSDPTGAPDLFDEQLTWLEERLRYARSHHNAAQIFVFAHHPFFLYHEDEDAEELLGTSALPPEWNPAPGVRGFPDSYFSIAKKYRKVALELFRRYGVDACFVGHFHQNLLTTTEWGMRHIITAPLSMVFDSTGKPTQPEINDRGMRIVDVKVDTNGGNGSSFTHRFESL